MVSLNCRTLANPAAKAISAAADRWSGAGPARCARAGPAPARRGRRPARRSAAAAPAGRCSRAGAASPATPFPVDHAVADQPHRPPDDIGPGIPLRGAGHRVGTAAPAGAETGALGGRGGREEARRSGVGAWWRGSSAGSRSRSWTTAKKNAPSNRASRLRTASYLLSSCITESTVQQVRRRRWRKSDGVFSSPQSLSTGERDTGVGSRAYRARHGRAARVRVAAGPGHGRTGRGRTWSQSYGSRPDRMWGHGKRRCSGDEVPGR